MQAHLPISEPILPPRSELSHILDKKSASGPESAYNGRLQVLQDASRTESAVTICTPGRDLGDYTRISYQQMLTSSERNANLLYRIPGLKKSTVILIHSDNHAENITRFWAIIRAGLFPANCNVHSFLTR